PPARVRRVREPRVQHRRGRVLQLDARAEAERRRLRRRLRGDLPVGVRGRPEGAGPRQPSRARAGAVRGQGMNPLALLAWWREILIVLLLAAAGLQSYRLQGEQGAHKETRAAY